MKDKHIESMFDNIEDKIIITSMPPKSPKQIIKDYIEQLEKENNIYNEWFDDLTELFNSPEYKDNAILLDDIRNLLMNMAYKVNEVKQDE